VREKGVAGSAKLTVYASKEVHTWLQKGADIAGLGTGSLREVPVNAALEMDVQALERMIAEDKKAGHQPVMVVGTAGSVSTGAIDPLERISELCRRESLWFHVDGAYGAPAAMLPNAPASLKALAL